MRWLGLRWRESAFRAPDTLWMVSLSGVSIDEYREMVSEWTRKIAALGHTARGYPKEFGGADDVGLALTASPANVSVD